MASRTEEAVGEHDVVIVLHELAGVVDGLRRIPYFLGLDGTSLAVEDPLAGEQFVGDVVELGVMMGQCFDLLVGARPSLHVVEQFVHVAGELDCCRCEVVKYNHENINCWQQNHNRYKYFV